MPASPTTGAARARGDLLSDATRFANRWAGATSESSDKQPFWDDLFAIFGILRRQVAVFEQLASRASTGNVGWIDLLFPGQMGVEHKSAGEDLDAAMAQLLDYLPALPPAELPWLLVVCDFQNFRWHNLETGQQGSFRLAELPDNIDVFAWMAGYNRPGRTYENVEDVNLAATKLMANLHDRLAANGYSGHALREWLTRILFCLFADDSGVWDRAAFHAWVALHTRQDGSDLGPQIAYLFQLLDTPEERRPANLDPEYAQFTYINGDLFQEILPIPQCDTAVRDSLLAACTFDWTGISPAIFGSMFQNVMTPAERRTLGAHYTSEENILRVIEPLFLKPLGDQLAAARTRPKLREFLDRLRGLKFLDPACGCGNFLVVSYRELRRLESAAVRRLLELDRQSGQLAVDVTLNFRVQVDQFYGIEIEEFPAKIARTAMYLMDHLCNREVSAEFGEHYARFPIPATPTIVNADALELPWGDVLPAESCDYCFGNPPFAGHTTRSRHQSDQMRAVWGRKYNKWLDYVTCWYKLSWEYGKDCKTQFAYVSTSSIAQGEQVARLWDEGLSAGATLTFAHQAFDWRNEASGRAHVHVVIEGFSMEEPRPDRILCTYQSARSEPECSSVRNISPYLVDAPNVLVHRRRQTLTTLLSPVSYGSLASDGGALCVEDDQYPDNDPTAARYLRPYVGSRELIHGLARWVIWAPDGIPAADVRASDFLSERLEQCRTNRLDSDNPDTQALAATPYRFFHVAQPESEYVGIPATVSANRRFYPVAYLSADTIASNAMYTVVDPTGLTFAILSSSMFMTWQRYAGGELRSDLRFSGGVVYNTLPLPQNISTADRDRLIAAGRAVIDARPPDSTLAQMYDPLATPRGLLAAHTELDRVVDRLFTRRRNLSDSDRAAVLLDAYAAATRPA